MKSESALIELAETGLPKRIKLIKVGLEVDNVIHERLAFVLSQLFESSEQINVVNH